MEVDEVPVQSFEKQCAVKDIDVKDQQNEYNCSTYVNQIYNNLRRQEDKYRPTLYMPEQKELNPKMRGILIDWLVEVSEEYDLDSETLFLAVNYLDRFLSKEKVMRGKLQLLGIVCMLLAAKYEEVYPPAVEEFVYISDNTYTKEEIFEMEVFVLNTLKFNLSPPTTKTYLHRYLKAVDADDKVTALASYLSELSLVEYQFINHSPSSIALSSVIVALHTLGRPFSRETLEFYAGYTKESFTKDIQLVSCVRDLHNLFANIHQSPFTAVKDKYALSKRLKVSTIRSSTSLPL